MYLVVDAKFARSRRKDTKHKQLNAWPSTKCGDDELLTAKSLCEESSRDNWYSYAQYARFSTKQWNF